MTLLTSLSIKKKQWRIFVKRLGFEVIKLRIDLFLCLL